jgi:membrane dipeptidase
MKRGMMKKKWIIPVIGLMVVLTLSAVTEKKDPELWKRALDIHHSAIVIDTHCDTPMAMAERGIHIGDRQTETNVDLIRMKEGGVDSSFFAVYVSNNLDEKHPSRKALEMIDEIYLQVGANPDQAEMAFSARDIINIERKGKRAILIGMENGGPIEGSLRLLRNYYRLGVRYVTLTHVKNNDICDSSTSKNPRWNGLSPFGREVVSEMNRLGMMIDVSHISDQAFWDVLDVSRAPVIASHSCCRSICDSARNLTDEMIRGLARKGGVIQINFFSAFLDPGYRQQAEAIRKKIEPQRNTLKEKYKNNQNRYWDALFELWKKHAPPPPEIDILITHIDHVTKLVGVDYVGLGSDYDGASSYPVGLGDVSGFPLITYHLLKKGFQPEDIKKILGGNLLRVFQQVEKAGSQ